VYELIGSEGVLRYDRQGRIFELVSKRGTQHLYWTEEKNFEGMYAEFVKALQTGQAGNMPTAADGLAATRIARVATEDLMRSRTV
jgi:predicted dehydrogenase